MYVNETTGEYTINAHYPAVTTKWHKKGTNAPAGGCENPPQSTDSDEGKTSPMSEAYAQSGITEISGQVDPKDPDTLSGEKITGVFRERVNVAPGEAIAMSPDVSLVHLFDAKTGNRIS